MSNLRAQLESLASSFAEGVLAAIRSASIDDLHGETGGGRRARGGGGQPDPLRGGGNGRLPRRSAEDIAKMLDRVIATVKKSKAKGLRAEEIRKALNLDVREVPRVLKEGIRTKKLVAKGRKRATTYYAR